MTKGSGERRNFRKLSYGLWSGVRAKNGFYTYLTSELSHLGQLLSVGRLTFQSVVVQNAPRQNIWLPYQFQSRYASGLMAQRLLRLCWSVCRIGSKLLSSAVHYRPESLLITNTLCFISTFTPCFLLSLVAVEIVTIVSRVCVLRCQQRLAGLFGTLGIFRSGTDLTSLLILLLLLLLLFLFGAFQIGSG